MKLVKWLSPALSAINGNALIRVEPDEDADIEKMLILIDGDSVGHFGLRAILVKTGDEMPKLEPKKYRGKSIGPGDLEPKKQFGYFNASSMKKQVRYYDVFVNRD